MWQVVFAYVLIEGWIVDPNKTIELLKEAQMFHKRNSYLDSNRGISTKTIINDIPEQCKAEVMEKDSEMDSDRESIHSDWSELISINNEINKTGDAMKKDA